MIKNFLLTLASLAFSLVLMEIFLIIFLPQNLTSSFRTYGKNGLLLNVKNKTTPIFHLGRHVTNYNFGKFHNRKYDLKENDNRILVLGDSFTFGWLLKDEDTFVYKLGKKLNNFSFINSAAGGWGTSDHLKYLKSFCKIVSPKYTLIFLNAADLQRSLGSNLFFLGNNKIREGNNKISRLKFFLEKSTIYNFSIKNFHIINLLKSVYLNNDKFIVNDHTKFVVNSDPTEFYKKLLLKFNEEAKFCNSKLIIINLGWYSYNESSGATNSFIKKNIVFLNKNFNFIDLNYDMVEVHKNYNKFSIKDDGHPNKLGSDFLYNVIYEKLYPLIN